MDSAGAFDLLFAKITDKVGLSASDREICKSLFVAKKLKKKEVLLRAGTVADQIAFVGKGCLRAYTIDKSGEEHIAQFALESWWITDFASFVTREPASYTIEAIEESEVLTINPENREKLFEQVPQFERFFRLLLEGNFVTLHRRLISTISYTAEEKYLQMQQKYPQILQRVPQHMVASFLGLKPETLSRIRRKLAKQDK